MRKTVFCLLMTLVSLEAGGESLTAGTIAVNNLRCEYLRYPLGIDVRQPRLSWELESPQRGQKQTAYQILVSANIESLAQDQGDLWDSGKVISDQSAQVSYAGQPLLSRMSCYWKVRVWDRDNKVSHWSEPAYWTMGLLEAGDWQASWIGYEAQPGLEWKKAVEPVDLSGCKWIWQGGEGNQQAPSATCYFRQKIAVPSDRQIKRARIRLSAYDWFELFVNGKSVATAQLSPLSSWHGPIYNLELTGMIQAGENVIAVEIANSGKNTAGLLGRGELEFTSGEPDIFTLDSTCKVTGQPAGNWKQLGFDDNGWGSAQEIAALGDAPWGPVDQMDLKLSPSPYLRKEFTVGKEVKRATLYVSALGFYEMHLNGGRVEQDFFTPGWTDYHQRIYYQSYDVTDRIKKGGNAIGAILADGWYAGYVGWAWKKNFYGSRPWLKAQLELEYDDGSRDVVMTDAGWKGHYGPILEADLLMGQTDDARLELTGWNCKDYDDSQWAAVTLKEDVSAPLQSHPGVPVQITGKVKAVAVTEPAPGKFVFDLGQNIGGWAQLRVQGGQPGDRITLRFAELLRPDGMLHTENLRGARCRDTYILRGTKNKVEVWRPCFTFRGFRYVEVTGYPGRPPLDAISGIVAHSTTPPTGSFECSNPMVNRLYQNILWTRRANLVEVPTDCCQRDERLGWTGDAGINIQTMTYDMDVAAFFTKWLVDVHDAQHEDGAYTDNAPNPSDPRAGTSGWGDGALICAWTIYEMYGDTRIIEKHYEGMTRWMEYLKNHSSNLLRPAEGYADWNALEYTPPEVLGTAFFANSVQLLSRMAEVIGRKEDAARYQDLFQQIRQAFNQAYVAEDGKIKGDTQTCYALALCFDLLPEEKRLLAGNQLVAAIERNHWHISTGIIGTGLLLPALTRIDRTDAAYRLLTNDTFPSWGYMIKNGATTLWECWDSWTQEKGYQDHSFNQPALGAEGQWLYDVVAGIQPEEPGCKRLRIKPQPGGGMTYVKAGYHSIRGRIATDWKIDGGVFTLDVTIPANTTATVFVPAENENEVTESGKPAGQAESVKFVRMENGAALYEVGSGVYHFVAKK